MSFPLNLNELLSARLAADRRPPDGKLHPSGALTGSLRHLQLDAAGAPQLDGDLVSEVNLAVGTAIHSYFETILRGKPAMLEVKLDRWLPEGWSGTADWLVWDDERRAFWLGDLKSCKPGGIHFINRDGAKESHIWQVSCYWHAARRMGIPLVNGAVVYYLPKNQLTAREGSPVMPTMQELTPLPEELVLGRMAERKAAVDTYLASLPNPQRPNPTTDLTAAQVYVNEYLAPVQERDLKMFLNKALKVPAIDVKLTPNWSTDYCPFPNELCDCSEQKPNKIGQWDRDEAGLLVYTPSKGAEQPADVPTPEPGLVAALVKAQREKEST